MSRKKREKEIPEDLEMLEEVPEEETFKVRLRSTPTPAVDKEAQWAKIESEVATVKDDFITGKVTLNEAIDRLVASLNTIKAAEAPGLTGLGARPEMDFPTPPLGPATPPEEELPPTT